MPKRRTPMRALSVREREVAALVAAGKSNRSISESLFLSERTVEHHVSAILNKLNVHSRVELMATMLGPMQPSGPDADPSPAERPRRLGMKRVIHRIRARLWHRPWFAKAAVPIKGRSRDSLPRPLTETVGRDDDVARVVAEVSRSRIVTVTGPGGIGKSRVAVEAGFVLRTKQNVSCAFVDLATCRTGEEAIAAVAAACDVPPVEPAKRLGALIATLDQHDLLLILDNCEHLTTHVANLTRAIVAGTPSVKLLVTSRRPIRLPGEQVTRIDALAIPPDGVPPAQLLQWPAVLLFASRARECSGVVFDDASLVASARICAALDGLPLALEIAATKTSALPVQRILAVVDDRFRSLATEVAALPHQRSLHALVDWSYQLLTPQQQALFRAISVLRSPWTIEAVQSLLDDAEATSILDGLVSLADQSLIQRSDSDGTPHFHMLETLRLFAAERAAECGEFAALQARHARNVHSQRAYLALPADRSAGPAKL